MQIHAAFRPGRRCVYVKELSFYYAEKQRFTRTCFCSVDRHHAPTSYQLIAFHFHGAAVPYTWPFASLHTYDHAIAISAFPVEYIRTVS
jgi:hypothetical protein